MGPAPAAGGPRLRGRGGHAPAARTRVRRLLRAHFCHRDGQAGPGHRSGAARPRPPTSRRCSAPRRDCVRAHAGRRAGRQPGRHPGCRRRAHDHHPGLHPPGPGIGAGWFPAQSRRGSRPARRDRDDRAARDEHRLGQPGLRAVGATGGRRGRRLGDHPGRAGVPDDRPDGLRERYDQLRGGHTSSGPGEGHLRPRLGLGLRAAGHARHDHRRRGDGLRVLRADGLECGPVDDRPGHPADEGPLDVARQRPEHQGRLAHLGYIWAGVSMLLAGSWYDQLNPFHYLAGAAGKVVADGWTAAMLGLWNAGLWAMRLVLNIMDAFLTPDLSENGPGAQIYAVTFWIAGALVLVMVMIQLGVAAIRRDGKSLATLLVGGAQFTIVWAAWVAYGVAVVAACGGLTRALMGSLLNVSSWSAWQPWAPFTTADIVDGTVATVLGLMGLLLWLAAIGHLLVMLTRGGALMVLSATTPISAAGLVSDAGRSWFWKSLRWFHAAAFTPVLMVLVLGIGIQMTTGVANGLADKTQAAIGTALPGVILILISCFAPLALFKLLAFVDPGTSSGAAVRQGLAAQGGLQGLLGGMSGSGESSGAAASTDENGRSQGESAGEDSTSNRFTNAAGGLLGGLGAVGSAAAAGLGAMASAGAKGASIGADLTNQMSVGHHTYQPDFGSDKKKSNNSGSRQQNEQEGQGSGDPNGTTPDVGGTPDQVTSPTTGATSPGQAAGGPQPPLPTPPTPGSGLSGSGSSGGGPVGPSGGAVGAEGAGGAEAAAVVAI